MAGSGIWTRDGGQAIRVSNKLDHGLVWINTHHRNDPSSPWGGYKSSGVGRVRRFRSLSGRFRKTD